MTTSNVNIDLDKGEVEAAITQAIDALSASNLINAQIKAAQVYMVGIRDRAPRLTGRLATSFYVAQIDSNTVTVGSDLVYAPIHEYGGRITAKSAINLRFVIGDRVIFTKSVNIPARPYVLPTFEADTPNAAQAFDDAIEI
jgi:phage gpG-like protein